ncbi:MAG: hypothetical protein ACPHID_04530 [Thermoplasmatota archaeon]
MKSKVKQNQEISNRKLQEHAKSQKTPVGSDKVRSRNSPAARKLDALRKKKAKSD